ncbi:MAG TPA: 1-acyl-sn-glycerol-3-phosphate acyltransferase [Gammaproteobacteria bacterium]|jgi:1-acyl-sn-glycerol-3-phosphate acyltransferase|uniref:1-acyl-sn-glycerol-3-phosphate acyltransferase n=1 Tax=hydrothermal vent metagenome TaxID=652676 RepID=A0A1W1DYJ5_9ZZZZ|nr:1-acyl-sn-glycerol-3-phosphate acyltransferase [Gammaproteobacteria bacterium]HAE05129.1 1-acyl-sn-glycerol-3-phosphate acyltransferase [Gammaproteobacteria bacterium]HAE70168.1 1-acyl-sn-glycerol-3-phosphate acyltransferase [Gammaproteobacteria bacterium]HAE73203.1 1-acyl-sn-glycerol-3-phosphate acyltransferase [Gammaproteobacteria bacterium]HAG47372.1 1-acyl-sn-glycerol-3-phosphate acyltransferase [Gammaproteobacteria bacterium]
MLFLRSLIYFLGSTLVLSALVAIALVLFFTPLKVRYAILSKWSLFCLWWLRITLNIKLNIIGKENIPNSACVIISNHQSTWETLALQTIFPHQTWVLKQELQWIPIFGWGLSLLKPIIINRGEKLKALKKVLKQGAARISEGIFVVVFPEGTRQPYGQLGEYQKGGVAIAKKTGCDISPVYHNAGKLWPKGSFVKQPGLITMVIGKSISVEGKSAAELTKEVRDWTEAQSLSIQ